MERRTFLKGALIAASTPAVALAPSLTNSLGSLIAEVTALDELYRVADEREGEIGRDPHRPAPPYIEVNEFGPFRAGFYPNAKRLYSEQEIVSLFDKERNYAELYREHWSDEQRVKVLKSANDRQSKALELFRLREAAYGAWQRESGYSAAKAEAARLAKLVGDVEDRILAFRPESIDDVRLKASFFDRAYGSAPPEHFVEAFVKSLVA